MSVSCKRKFEEVEEEEKLITSSPTEQRKSILDISMTKLRSTPHRKVEPSLRRSVLIFNTLKNIENQLKLEGVCVPKTSTAETVSDLVPALQVPSSSEDILDALPNAQTVHYSSSHHTDGGGGHMDYHHHHHHHQQEDSVASTCPLVSTPAIVLPHHHHHNAHTTPTQPLMYSGYHHHQAPQQQPQHISSTSPHYTQHTTTSSNHQHSQTSSCCSNGQMTASESLSSAESSCPYTPAPSGGLESPSSSVQAHHLHQVGQSRSAGPATQDSWGEVSAEGSSSNVSQPSCPPSSASSSSSSTSESVLSDTSKFILDSILTTSVASFTSLFELDNNELIGTNSSSSSNNSPNNLNNINSSTTSPSASTTVSSSSSTSSSLSSSSSISPAAEGIPPISCLCSKNMSRNTPYLPPSWSQSAEVSSTVQSMCHQQSPAPPPDMTPECSSPWTHNSSSSSDLTMNCISSSTTSSGSISTSSINSPPYQQHFHSASSFIDASSSSQYSSVFFSSSDWNPAPPHAGLVGSGSPPQLLSAAQGATSCRQESSFVESQSMFGDVDCSSFDFDLFLPSLSPSMKLTQLNHEDLIHSLPTPDVGFGSNCTSTPSLLNPKTESHGDELDRIMQIVVGI